MGDVLDPLRDFMRYGYELDGDDVHAVTAEVERLRAEVARLTAERDEADNIVRAVHAWLVSDPVDDVRSVLAFADLETAVTAYVDAKGGE